MRLLDRAQALGEGVGMALDAIRANRVRAGLTVLGVAVGVFVVTAMSAAVHGINAGVQASLAASGPKTFFLSKWPPAINSCTGAADSCPWRRYPPLTTEEVQGLERLPSVRAAAAQVQSSAAFKYGDKVLPGAGYLAYTPSWGEVDGSDISAGRNFTPAENAAGALVMLINPAMREQLFGTAAALGERVSVGAQPFRVIGIFNPVANVFSGAAKPQAIIPFETARRRLNMYTAWLQISVKPRDEVAQDVAIDDVIGYLRTERGLEPGEDNNFFIATQEKILDVYNRVVGVFFIVMITLSGIGLLVGGVGVVAIMMISVTERTREIGIRKALGATRALILWQFLVEAATLTLIGAVAGLAVGALLTWLIRSQTPIQASIPPLAIVAAVATSALTGVLFGLLPALRAARLDPVDALRYE